MPGYIVTIRALNRYIITHLAAIFKEPSFFKQVQNTIWTQITELFGWLKLIATTFQQSFTLETKLEQFRSEQIMYDQ